MPYVDIYGTPEGEAMIAQIAPEDGVFAVLVEGVVAEAFNEILGETLDPSSQCTVHELCRTKTMPVPLAFFIHAWHTPAHSMNREAIRFEIEYELNKLGFAGAQVYLDIVKAPFKTLPRPFQSKR